MPKEVFSMVISVFDDGSVNLTGPLDNQILCLGLLEAAKKKVNDHNEKKDRPVPDLSVKTLTHDKVNAFGRSLTGAAPVPPVKDARP